MMNLKKTDYESFFIGIIIVFFLVGYIVFPIFQIGVTASSNFSYAKSGFSSETFTACVNSLLISIISVIGSGMAGASFAYLLHFKKIWFRKFISIIILLPIAIPPIVSVMSYLFLLGENGLIAKIFAFKNFHFTGWWAIVVVHIYSFYPLFYMLTNNALKTIDNSIIEAAHTLGASKYKTLWLIILPLLKPALYSASLLTFMASMASFSAPFIFGSSERFLTTEIFYSKINGNLPMASFLSLLLIVICATVFFVQNKINSNSSGIKSKGTKKVYQIHSSNKYDIFYSCLILFLTIIIALPLISLFLLSVINNESTIQKGLNIQFTVNNFILFFSDSSFIEPFYHSISTSFVAVIITILISSLIATTIIKKRNFSNSSIEFISSLPYGIPGTVLAIGLILSFNNATIFSGNTILVGTFIILPIVYTIRNLPIMVQSLKTGLQSLDISLEEAAATMGASKWHIWFGVILPQVAPFLIEGALLVFINSFGEFVATILLYNFSTKTMSVEIYSQLRNYNNGLAAANGVILFLIIIAIIGLSNWLKSKFIIK